MEYKNYLGGAKRSNLYIYRKLIKNPLKSRVLGFFKYESAVKMEHYCSQKSKKYGLKVVQNGA